MYLDNRGIKAHNGEKLYKIFLEVIRRNIIILPFKYLESFMKDLTMLE